MASVAPDLEQLAERAEALTAEELVAEMVERFHPRLYLACSFQKEETVLVDMLVEAGIEPRVFTIDTGVLFEETLQTWRAFEQRWGLKVEVFDASNLEGRPWTGPEHCCSDRKVEALDAALSGIDAWITGLRREQAPTRANTDRLSFDERRGVWKANPLAEWAEADVWRRIHERELPYNPLHDRGYASIGCSVCTQPGEGREGRWAGTDKTECGLHIEPAGS